MHFNVIFFNTIKRQLQKLITKPLPCNRILEFLTEPFRLDAAASSSITLSTGALQGFMLSSSLFSLMTQSSYHTGKLVGFDGNKDEMTFRAKVEELYWVGGGLLSWRSTEVDFYWGVGAQLRWKSTTELEELYLGGGALLRWKSSTEGEELYQGGGALRRWRSSTEVEFCWGGGALLAKPHPVHPWTRWMSHVSHVVFGFLGLSSLLYLLSCPFCTGTLSSSNFALKILCVCVWEISVTSHQDLG